MDLCIVRCTYVGLRCVAIKNSLNRDERRNPFRSWFRLARMSSR